MWLEAGRKLCSGPHMDGDFRILPDGLEIFSTAPLSVVGHPGAIHTLVDSG